LAASPPTSRRKRSLKILRLFFGLVAGFVYELFLHKLTGRSYSFFQDSKRNRARAIRIRTVALEMGGVLIKVGQFLSTRVDLLPPEYIEELALLQDEVPGVAFAEIRSVIEQELESPLGVLFRSLDEMPLAAASLGQVHRGILPTGEHVAVKVQRPGIAAIVEADLGTFRYIVSWIDRHTPISRRVDLPLILEEFEHTLRLELNYTAEGHHAERISISFRDNPEIAVPRVYWSHSSARVITLQYMHGTKITEFAAVESQNINRRRVAEILMSAYLKQILSDGFFHADPHPGNLFVRPGPVVVLIDFGMVGKISAPMRNNIQHVFLGIVRRDYDEVLSALAKLGFFAPHADRVVLKRALVWTVENFYEMSFAELKAVDPLDVLNQLQDVFYEQAFQIPANFAFLGRALGTLSGLCTALDPSFQFVSVAEPYARELIRESKGRWGTWNYLGSEVKSLALAAYSLPYLTRDVLSKVHQGELDFRHELGEVVRAVDRLERAMRRLLYALLVTGFLVAGAYIVPTHYSLLSIAAFAISMVLLVFVLSPFRRRR
jgi:predicted unusual protein kinase regulating ubiquinone biosynthesis (AarF/ABC1/UbiB family)